jgi:hypothetical protein
VKLSVLEGVLASVEAVLASVEAVLASVEADVAFDDELLDDPHPAVTKDAASPSSAASRSIRPIGITTSLASF